LNLRQLWSNYFDEVDGIVYVVDAADPDRFTEAKNALETALLYESLSGKPLLILVNKSDMESAKSPDIVESSLSVGAIKGRPVNLVSCSAKENLNLDNGFRWIINEAVKYRQLKSSVS
jgi:GTP-binding protein SAR1